MLCRNFSGNVATHAGIFFIGPSKKLTPLGIMADNWEHTLIPSVQYYCDIWRVSERVLFVRPPHDTERCQPLKNLYTCSVYSFPWENFFHFGSRRHYGFSKEIWLQINRKIVNTIWFHLMTRCPCQDVVKKRANLLNVNDRVIIPQNKYWNVVIY